MSVTTPRPPIVVGVDGGAASLAALVWAREEADAHGVALVVVHVLDPRYRVAPYAPAPASSGPDSTAAEGIKELLNAASGSPVEHVFEVGVPSVVLVERSRGTRMLVLGGHTARHHRRDGEDYLSGPALGPVSRACVARAQCPVVVLPEPLCVHPVSGGSDAPHGASEPVRGARATDPFQGRIPVAHH